MADGPENKSLPLPPSPASLPPFPQPTPPSPHQPHSPPSLLSYTDSTTAVESPSLPFQFCVPSSPSLTLTISWLSAFSPDRAGKRGPLRDVIYHYVGGQLITAGVEDGHRRHTGFCGVSSHSQCATHRRHTQTSHSD